WAISLSASGPLTVTSIPSSSAALSQPAFTLPQYSLFSVFRLTAMLISSALFASDPPSADASSPDASAAPSAAASSLPPPHAHITTAIVAAMNKANNFLFINYTLLCFLIGNFNRLIGFVGFCGSQRQFDSHHTIIRCYHRRLAVQYAVHKRLHFQLISIFESSQAPVGHIHGDFLIADQSIWRQLILTYKNALLKTDHFCSRIVHIVGVSADLDHAKTAVLEFQ